MPRTTLRQRLNRYGVIPWNPNDPGLDDPTGQYPTYDQQAGSQFPTIGTDQDQGRLPELERERGELTAPLTLKQKIIRALVMGGTVGAGAVFGGEAGATGAAEGVSGVMEQRGARRRKRVAGLDEAIANERARVDAIARGEAGREERRPLREAQTDLATARAEKLRRPEGGPAFKPDKIVDEYQKGPGVKVQVWQNQTTGETREEEVAVQEKGASRPTTPFQAEMYGTPEEKGAADRYRQRGLADKIAGEGRAFERGTARATERENVKMRQEVRKMEDSARTMDVFSRISDTIVKEVLRRGTITGPEFMQLLSTHLGGTVGGIPRVRIGLAIIEKHIRARPWDQGLQAMWRNLTEGGNISMEQAQEWAKLARMVRAERWRAVVEAAQSRGVEAPQVPEDISSEVAGQSPLNGVPPHPAPEGMKWQQNKATREFRLVPK